MLSLRGVAKSFGETAAVEDVDLEVAAGEFLTLLGPSGCGKSTLLRIIAGLVEADRGQVRLDGEEIQDLPAHRRRTAMVFQSYALFPHMTVERNTAFGLVMRGLERSRIERRVAETLALVELDGLGGRYPRELSGGQQQRVALARALVTEPRVLLLDEPLSNLDAKLRDRLRIELRALQRRLGLTTVFVTHDQAEAMALSDRIAVMSKGRLIETGTPEEIYSRPQSRFAAEFVGIANLLSGTLSDDGRHRFVDTALGRFAALGDARARGAGCFDLPAAGGYRPVPRGSRTLREADPCHLCRPVPGLHRRDGARRASAARACPGAALAYRRKGGRAAAGAGRGACRRFGSRVSTLIAAPTRLPAPAGRSGEASSAAGAGASRPSCCFCRGRDSLRSPWSPRCCSSSSAASD